MAATVSTDLTVAEQVFDDKLLMEAESNMPLTANMEPEVVEMAGKSGDTAYWMKPDSSAMAGDYTEGGTISVRNLTSNTVSKQVGTIADGVGISYQSLDDTKEMIIARELLVAKSFGAAFGRRMEDNGMVEAQNNAMQIYTYNSKLKMGQIYEVLADMGIGTTDIGSGMMIMNGQAHVGLIQENDGYLFGNSVTGNPRYQDAAVGMVGTFNVFLSDFTRSNKTFTIIPAAVGDDVIYCRTGRGFAAGNKAVISWFADGEKKTQDIVVESVTRDAISLASGSELTVAVPTGAMVTFALDAGDTDPAKFTDTLIIAPGSMGVALKRSFNVKLMDRPDKQEVQYYATSRYAFKALMANRIAVIRNTF